MIYWLIIFIVLLTINIWRILKNVFMCLKKSIWIQYSSLIIKHFNALKAFNLIVNIWFFKNIIELITVGFSLISWGESSKFKYDRTGILNNKRHRELNKIIFEIIIKIRHIKSSRVRDCYNCICKSRHRLFNKH